MSRDSKYIMRALLILLLFQFISPSVLSVVTMGSAPGDTKTTLTSAHSSIIVPVFLKEKDEREHEENSIKSFDLVPFLNFSNHSHTHTAYQSLIYKGRNGLENFTYEPPLFKLHCTFLI